MILRKILAGIFWIVVGIVGFVFFPLFLTTTVAMLSDGLADAIEDDNTSIAGLLVLVTVSQLAWFVYLANLWPKVT